MLPSRASFTLIELLVTIAIVAVISVVVVVVLNPVQLLKQARDSNRLSDLQTLSKAVYLFETDQPGGSLGNASTTYFSIVDPAATSTAGTNCSGVGGLTPPSGWTYRCAASSSFRKTDGTGWVPVNFDQMSFRAISALPVDPVNTTSSGLYYSYTPGGSFELTAAMESDKYKLGGIADKVSTDGGESMALYETGSSRSLNPVDYGDSSLVGWWPLEEGGGTTAGDKSGNGNSGTLTNEPIWQTAVSCKVGGCLSFDGVDDYVNLAEHVSRFAGLSEGSISVWFKGDSILATQNVNPIFQIAGPPNMNDLTRPIMAVAVRGTGSGLGGAPVFQWIIIDKDSNDVVRANAGSGLVAPGTWIHAVVTVQKSVGNKIYLNGVQVTPAYQAGNSATDKFFDVDAGDLDRMRIAITDIGQFYWKGLIDDVRVYSRALSAAEIQAIYNATK